MAEHMLILGVESPEGEMTYVAAAFPSACGKTNFAMMIPPAALQGLEDLDRRRRHRVDARRRRRAAVRDQPRGRLLRRRAGHERGVEPERHAHDHRTTRSSRTSPSPRTATCGGRARTARSPNELIDWKGNAWKPKGSPEKAAHPNSRFTAPATNNPALSRFYDDPAGVPISAIIFGGRRASTIPLVMQAFNWKHGVYFGATMGSETTAAATGKVGVVRRDPMAMLPFCGYNMGEYFGHWLDMQARIKNPPKVFLVNWFRKDEAGKFLWPGFGENMRVLKWIVDRARLRVGGQETLFGWVPKAGDLDLSGLHLPAEQVDEATHIDVDEWRAELQSHGEFFQQMGASMPRALELQRELMLARIDATKGQ